MGLLPEDTSAVAEQDNVIIVSGNAGTTDILSGMMPMMMMLMMLGMVMPMVTGGEGEIE